MPRRPAPTVAAAAAQRVAFGNIYRRHDRMAAACGGARRRRRRSACGAARPRTTPAKMWNEILLSKMYDSISDWLWLCRHGTRPARRIQRLPIAVTERAANFKRHTQEDTDTCQQKLIIGTFNSTLFCSSEKQWTNTLSENMLLRRCGLGWMVTLSITTLTLKAACQNGAL